MKRMKVLSVLAALVAAVTFVACNTDSESYVAPTQAEATAMFSAVGSSHYGNFVYYSENKANVNDYTDTLAVHCNVRAADSTAILRGVPASIFAKYVTDSDLSEAIAQCSETDVKIQLIPYKVSGYTFVANPYDVTFENVNYKGSSHTVSFKFWASVNAAWVSATTSGSTTSTYFIIDMTMAYVYLDGKQTSYLGYTINNKNVTYPAFRFYAKK